MDIGGGIVGKIYCAVHFNHYYADLEIDGDISDILKDPSKAVDIWTEAWAIDPGAMNNGRWVVVDGKKVRIDDEMAEMPYEVVCIIPGTDKVYIWKGEK